jgi:hypothetical protein
MSTSIAEKEARPNRTHRRVVLRDWGGPIFSATSCRDPVAALEGCITGHQSLYNAGFLHKNIPMFNLMINYAARDDPSRFSFLINLELAIKMSRTGPSGAKDMTGTKAFMAVDVLFYEEHNVFHDLEYFFWVLFWICIYTIHYNGLYDCRVMPEFEEWNYMASHKLAREKTAIAYREKHSLEVIRSNITPFYSPLVPCVNRLRMCVFPDNGHPKGF